MSPGSQFYIGLMSGTSLDGVDIAIADFEQPGLEVVHCHTQPYPKDTSSRIRQITRAEQITLDQLGQLDVEIGQFYADVVNQALSTTSIPMDQVIAVGCHGQTIRHNPTAKPTYTLQIGDPNTLSAMTGLTTVADFRRRDIALGGQGAPLAPAFHQYMFRSKDYDRVIINIGGIANITFLAAEVDKPVIGFDTGPGNTLLDYWVNKHRQENYDSNGDWAASGQIIEELLENMLSSEAYFSQHLPKSTGTEYFCPEWLDAFSLDDYAPVDVQATLLELSATTIIRGILQLDVIANECYVCGGGVHNRQLMNRLNALLPETAIMSTEQLGIDPDFVEAIAFAWLARQTINQQTGNIPSVTSASTSAILGGIYQRGAS